jgi:PD-(D/E)XK nuclease family transposase
MDFADVKNDIAFRKIFGNEQKTAPLISFLNAALQLEGNERVASVSLANPYQFKKSTELNFIPDFAQTDEGLNTAFIEADRHNWTKEERIA